MHFSGPAADDRGTRIAVRGVCVRAIFSLRRVINTPCFLKPTHTSEVQTRAHVNHIYTAENCVCSSDGCVVFCCLPTQNSPHVGGCRIIYWFSSVRLEYVGG